jgi:RHS repeat-associated protein
VQSTTPRGFTDHEHVDNLGVIHMNGRVYDPVLGRFLSPDPVVQAPYDAQSWNRYSYVRNNPLRYTDPSGFVCFNSAPPHGFMPDYCFRSMMETIVVEASRIRDSLSSLSVDLWRSSEPSDGSRGAGSLSGERGEASGDALVLSSGPIPPEAPAQDSVTPTEEVVVTAARILDDAVSITVDAADFAARSLVYDYRDPLGGSFLLEAATLLPITKVGKIAKLDVIEDVATTVIGRVKDLRSLPDGYRSLLDRLPDRGNPKANWAQNSGVLRSEMRRGLPVRDMSPGDNSGAFLNAERSLLRDRGWSFDDRSNYWMPPEP